MWAPFFVEQNISPYKSPYLHFFYHWIWTQFCVLLTGKVYVSSHKICVNSGFHWPVFFCIRTVSMILALYGRIRISENSYTQIICSVFKVFTGDTKIASTWVVPMPLLLTLDVYLFNLKVHSQVWDSFWQLKTL